MGKQIITQRRGRGTTTYRSHSHRFKAEIRHVHTNPELQTGKVLDLINCPGHTAPIAHIVYDNNSTSIIAAPLGLKVGANIESGEHAKISPGNLLPLKFIPEGTDISNIEAIPGDGGKFCRSSGVSAKLLKKTNDFVTIKFSSKKEKKLHPMCRAVIGIVAGGGRLEKPLFKAGKNHHRMRARGKLYPRTSGVAMNAVDHPFGSGRGRQHAKIKVVSRHAPPGKKVGKVSARRTGRK